MNKFIWLLALSLFSVFDLSAQSNGRTLETMKRNSKFKLESSQIAALWDSLSTIKPSNDHRFGYSASGMMNASDTCLTEWDKLLNNYYQLLKEELSYDQFIVVRESQRKWLVYREEELGFLASNLPEGMIYREIYFGRRTSIVKERVEELQHIYSMIPDLSKMHLIEFPGIRAIGWE